MFNSINLRHTGINYPSFSKGRNNSRFAQAPEYIHKFSLNETLNEQDEFHRYSQRMYYKNEKTRLRNGVIKKVLAFTAAIGGILFLEAKNII